MRTTILSIGILIAGASPFVLHAQVAPSPTQPEQAVFEALVTEAMRPPRRDGLASDEELTKAQLRSKLWENQVRTTPDQFAPLIRAGLRLPDARDLDVPRDTKGGMSRASPNFQRQTATAQVAARLLPLLRREQCDEMLREFFEAGVRVARQAEARSVAAFEEWKRTGRDPEARTGQRILSRQSVWYTHRCAELLDAAAAAKSEVLVEPLFVVISNEDHLTALNRRAMAYLETLTERREEMIRRLKELLASGKNIGGDRRYNIEKAIDRLENAIMPHEEERAPEPKRSG